MKNTGAARKVDELGLVVIPVELHRTLGIAEGTVLGFHVDGENIVLRKHERSYFVTGEVANIVKKQFIMDMVSNHRIVQEKGMETLIN